MVYTYEYPRPAVTTDVVLLAKQTRQLLLIQRGNEPYKGLWALPGGFVDMDEELSDAALRELREETGIDTIAIEQFKTYGGVNRDPRHRTISVVYIAVTGQPLFAQGMDDAADARWFDIDKLPHLAFDHQLIIEEALQFLANNGGL
ncbi:NUDIX hydrolase [Carboxylicivirga sediminis]|uniref:NUDIX hydrolase n=1 Tax=Carboxylicivirga sediminis TaxID=2006564 RepID=A0A941F7I1_9BACT|nr:NUDIX hydrolase [Carboxylicivirga sediminis]MBR8538266.1 NUDIX hydrolase [Carboxylicivirga sediminis]